MQHGIHSEYVRYFLINNYTRTVCMHVVSGSKFKPVKWLSLTISRLMNSYIFLGHLLSPFAFYRISLSTSFSSTSHSFCVVTLVRIIHFLESTAKKRCSKLYKDFSETIFSYSVFSSKFIFLLYRLHLCKMILRACSTDYFSFQAKHINRSMNANPITYTEYCCIAMNECMHACFIFVPFLFNW